MHVCARSDTENIPKKCGCVPRSVTIPATASLDALFSWSPLCRLSLLGSKTSSEPTLPFVICERQAMMPKVQTRRTANMMSKLFVPLFTAPENLRAFSTCIVLPCVLRPAPYRPDCTTATPQTLAAAVIRVQTNVRTLLHHQLCDTLQHDCRRHSSVWGR